MATPHVFGRTRPSESGKHAIQITPKRDTHFRELPQPTGPAPFHLNLKDIIPKKQYDTIVSKKQLTFHFNGDMGGIRNGVSQKLVAKGMEADFDPQLDASENAAFLYIVGDCVYFNGEVAQYFTQFYEPYEFYPAPIFAVPGNHDGENKPNEDTLQGFLRNFCAPAPIKQPESGESTRTAMTQPNVYWTLLTPLVNIVGLYSNVPAGGDIREPQITWLASELKTLPKNIPIIVTLHHPVYSADDHHGGSTFVKEIIDAAVKKTGRQPEMIVAGHVHNYQRITKKIKEGLVPFLVTGAGGYENLHNITKVHNKPMMPPVEFKDEGGETVTLENYNDDHHGFLRLEVSDKKFVGKYFTVPRPHESYTLPSKLADRWEFDWKNRKKIPNQL